MSKSDDVEITPGHPGDILRDVIHDNRATVAGVARSIGMTRANLNRILAGNSRLLARHAVALEGLGWGTAELWMRLQAAWDIEQARREAA